MDMTVSAEMEALRDVVATFLERKSPIDRVRQLLDDERGYDEDTWAQAAEQIGLQGLLIPEEYGGQGSGLREMAVVAEEAGRRLWGAPLLSSAVLATLALQLADESAKAEYLPQLAEGTLVAALGVCHGRGPGRAPNEMTAAGNALSGTIRFVLDAGVAGLLVVPVVAGAGIDLYAVPGDAPGLTVTVLPSLDLTRRLASVTLQDTPAALIGHTDAEALAGVLDAGYVVLAADQLGMIDHLVRLSVDYARVRRQFGHPIGSFQAIQHHCADMYVVQESAAALLLAASSTLAEGEPGGAVAASLVQAYTSEETSGVAETALQVHGGIGFTWEHEIHLYLRRAKVDELLLGDAATHRAYLAAELGLLDTAGAA